MQPTHNLIVSTLKIGKLVNEEFIWFGKQKNRN
jgi:hypothetical protein